MDGRLGSCPSSGLENCSELRARYRRRREGMRQSSVHVAHVAFGEEDGVHSDSDSCPCSCFADAPSERYLAHIAVGLAVLLLLLALFL